MARNRPLPLTVMAAGFWCVSVAVQVVAGDVSAPPPAPPPAPKPETHDLAGTVREVRIEGTRHYSPDRIRFILTTRPGRVYDPQAMSDDIHAIENMGPFTNVVSHYQDNEDGTKTVIISVTELAYVSSVTFSNVGYFEKQGLDKVVQTKAGNNLNQAIIDSDRQALVRHFQDKGFRYVQVAVHQKDDHGNVSVEFSIQKGNDIEISQVRFVGLPQHLFPRQISAGLLNSEDNSYHPELLASDQKTVTDNAWDLGWLDAKLSGTRVEDGDYVRSLDERHRHGPRAVPDDEYNDTVTIVYELVPGDRYYLGSVSFIGNTKATQQELRKAFRLADGVPYKRVDIEKAIERARRVVSNQGFARARLSADRNFDYQKHEINLVLHMLHEEHGELLPGEGEKYHMRRIDIRGNYQTKDAVVRRAIALKPGDQWNDDQVDESKRQIERTGLFKSEKGFDHPLRVSPVFSDDHPHEADLRVDLSEDTTGTLNFQVGYSSASGIFVQTGFGERNIDLWGFIKGLFNESWYNEGFHSWRGGAQNVQVSVLWSRYTTSGGVSWTNPHLFDGPYSMTVAYNYIDSTYRPWEEIRNIPSVTIGRSFLRNDLNLSLTYSYTDLHVENPQIDAPNDALDGSGKYFLNTLSLGQSFDHLDNPKIPTTGFLLSSSESLAGEILPSSTSYWEYSLRGDDFLPLIEGEQGGVTYFHTSVRWRQIFGLDGDSTLPFYARYYGGGPTAHRGFEQDHLSPVEINRNGVQALVGGTSDFLASGEFSVPVQDNNEGIRLALFTDIGNVWGANQRMHAQDLRTAIGFGIRFPIQLPVSLDFAWLLDPQGQASTQIQFTLGQVHF